MLPEQRMLRVARFGAFEADLQSEELRRQGLKVRLRGKPFRILALLLERPGEPVTRQELREKLWHDGTFVDFDHGLNNAVNKLREALGDSASIPRFIETLPGLGYRFIAPVALDGGQVENAAPALPKSPEGARPQPALLGLGLLF